ncbi:MAG: PEP/pyruvate-binding domain-containing protein [Candidatus Hodarchaeales archaeon]|jgi:DNA-binding NarL/FixJ family response regulator
MSDPSTNAGSNEEFRLDYKPKYQIFHDLMLKRINKVLLVSSYYDNFILEEDGRLSDQIFEEFHNLNLRTLPIIVRVTTAVEALELLQSENFDLVITMRRLGDMDLSSFGKKVKSLRNIPVILLLNNAADVPFLPDILEEEGIDKIFLWNGDSTVFVAIVKYLEDQQNVAHDTKAGLVRVIIVVEDNFRYYSVFLPLIYSEIMKQIHRLISEGANDYHHLLQMRTRPKILLASTFEQAMNFYQQYKNYVIGVISDVRFPRNGQSDDRAGLDLIEEIKKDNSTLPVALQSSNEENRIRAENLGVFFIHKHSRKLLRTIRHFMLNYLGFGDFKFRLSDGTTVARAKNVLELSNALSTVPDESLIYHGTYDHFSGWLMNRGEFDIAQKIKPRKVSEFTEPEALRDFLLSSVRSILTEKTGGVIHDFSRESYHPDIRFTRLRPGSLGGKGRGIAFLQFLLNSFLLADELSQVVSIRIPKTIVIGTDEFDRFMEDNEELYEIALSDKDDDLIKRNFIKSKLDPSLIKDLSYILRTLTGPLSVRSSSLLEDSQYQPFAGVFETYMLPNNQDFKTRVKLLCNAIKLVYASSYMKQAKSYAESTGQSIEESKMAVVIQQVVGRKRPNNLSYPCFSGVATSYNYYPISYMKPEDRIVFIALGLGKTIVDGGLSHRFCPRYPEVSFYSTQDQIFLNGQKEFFGIDLSSKSTTFEKGEESFLSKVSIFDAEPETLARIADTYDYNDQVIKPGYYSSGAPIITFSSQLKYESLPFARLLTRILSLGEQTMGSSVEIEFAGNFQHTPTKQTTFYLLQIRPFTQYDITLDEEKKDLSSADILVKSSLASGNRIIKDIFDIVYAKPDAFDKLKTQEMVSEVDMLNKQLKDEGAPYILIGFGRWGTFDTSLGIPVKWNHISGAQVIIETGLKDFQIDHSQGSHFFQNITTANIGYLFVNIKTEEDNIDWEWFSEQEAFQETEFFKHIRLPEPFYVRINGRKREGIILKPSDV